MKRFTVERKKEKKRRTRGLDVRTKLNSVLLETTLWKVQIKQGDFCGEVA